jgi:hypothetical protein
MLTTTIKPEATLSLVAGGVSAGLHYAHAPYFIRRIRISSDDALARAALALGWKCIRRSARRTTTSKRRAPLVIDFPVASGAAVTKGDVPALAQLRQYIRFQRHLHTQHNSSNTITVRPEEWDGVERAIKDVWDSFVGVSFLAYDGGTYQLAPTRPSPREQYEALKAASKPFDPATLSRFEVGESADVEDDDCASGACPVR